MGSNPAKHAGTIMQASLTQKRRGLRVYDSARQGAARGVVAKM